MSVQLPSSIRMSSFDASDAPLEQQRQQDFEVINEHPQEAEVSGSPVQVTVTHPQVQKAREKKVESWGSWMAGWAFFVGSSMSHMTAAFAPPMASRHSYPKPWDKVRK